MIPRQRSLRPPPFLLLGEASSFFSFPFCCCIDLRRPRKEGEGEVGPNGQQGQKGREGRKRDAKRGRQLNKKKEERKERKGQGELAGEKTANCSDVDKVHFLLLFVHFYLQHLCNPT